MRTKVFNALAVMSVIAVASIVLAACGSSGSSTAKPNSSGVVEITMKDQKFSPDRIELKAGETVTFRFMNDGALVHEAFIGTMAELFASDHPVVREFVEEDRIRFEKEKEFA